MNETNSKKITAKANTNIALIKYWGKKDESLFIPTNDSLSLTLDEFYTQTTVQFSSQLKQDKVIFDSKELSSRDNQYKSITNFLNLIRKKANCNSKAIVDTKNTVPNSAGFASSASGFAALTAASSKAIGLNLSNTELSKLARRGSGSATRSIFGGFVQWHAGNSDQTSYAENISNNTNNIRIISIINSKSPKKISSRQGMRLSKTSPIFPMWIKVAKKNLQTIKKAIQSDNINLIGAIAEYNALCMHATTVTAQKPFTYFNKSTIDTINYIIHLRNNFNLHCYFTIDAGPNVKLICSKNELELIMDLLTKKFDLNNLVVAHSGSGIKYL